eukprot:266506-Pleurochrysis_carterae.AAC.2
MQTQVGSRSNEGGHARYLLSRGARHRDPLTGRTGDCSDVMTWNGPRIRCLYNSVRTRPFMPNTPRRMPRRLLAPAQGTRRQGQRAGERRVNTGVAQETTRTNASRGQRGRAGRIEQAGVVARGNWSSLRARIVLFARKLSHSHARVSPAYAAVSLSHAAVSHFRGRAAAFAGEPMLSRAHQSRRRPKEASNLTAPTPSESGTLDAYT